MFEDLGVGEVCGFGGVEGVVGGVDEVERGAGGEGRADGAEEREVGESVAGALEEEHGLRDFRQVIGALYAGAARRVKREAEENEPFDGVESALCGGFRGHATAHGLAPGEDRQAGKSGCGGANGSSYGGGE